ncbi:OmpA family protein [Roseococcus pinisoli]|uniref:OmpA family protein n=1 Tax=Roseococcus pinisoli TaxID=2835040 RepID=A0ABS5QGF6_9PROT|nr:OmpA family protein [Roseococcus pinisoli]MBS7812679.1 OmpA family protein [Roseococcus pinisoli]
MHRRLLLSAAMLPLLAACAELDPILVRNPANLPHPVVFFNEDSQVLDDAAKGTVREAADTARRFPDARVNVFGYAGPAGGAAFNRQLSDARAQHVASLLRQYGVASERIFVVPRGPVAFDMAPIESRRVEIRFAETPPRPPQ